MASWLGVQIQWGVSKKLFAVRPLRFISVPFVAAGVGFVTNYIGVNMLFYPLEDSLSFKRWPDQPLGLLGWQGIVPCKRVTMASTLVDVTLSRLLKISEVFERLDPSKMADALQHSMRDAVLGGMLPLSVVHYLLEKVAKAIIKDIEQIVSIKDIVVSGLTTDAGVLGAFFQEVGREELKYLINSGTHFGFVLGVVQMLQLMIYPAYWTLPISGAAVGFITNWIALQLIFRPVDPMPIKWSGETMWTFQGFCLARQDEISETFSEYIASNVLTSQEIWTKMLYSSDGLPLRNIIEKTLPFLPGIIVDTIMKTLRKELSKPEGFNVHTCETKTPANNVPHTLHSYTDSVMQLDDILISRLKRLTPVEFERILHPIFEEDEIILIVSGGILGMIAGAIQWRINMAMDNWSQTCPYRGVPPFLPIELTKKTAIKVESNRTFRMLLMAFRKIFRK